MSLPDSKVLRDTIDTKFCWQGLSNYSFRCKIGFVVEKLLKINKQLVFRTQGFHISPIFNLKTANDRYTDSSEDFFLIFKNSLSGVLRTPLKLKLKIELLSTKSLIFDLKILPDRIYQDLNLCLQR